MAVCHSASFRGLARMWSRNHGYFEIIYFGRATKIKVYKILSFKISTNLENDRRYLKMHMYLKNIQKYETYLEILKTIMELKNFDIYFLDWKSQKWKIKNRTKTRAEATAKLIYPKIGRTMRAMYVNN